MTYKLPKGLTPLECRALLYYLESEREVDRRDGLAFQLAHAEASGLEHTGVGFFRRFTLLPSVPVAHALPNGAIDIGYAEHPELVGGAIFVLFIEEGVVSYLESVTLSGDWPQDEDAFSFS